MKKTGFGLEHGDVPAGLFVEDAKVDVGHGGIAACGGITGTRVGP